jgi:hypothetical protein
MLRLHRSFLRSKLDCGCFVYFSATKSKLSIINPIHNTGIRLVTGAYRTSCLESLYAESGEPPLKLQRNLLLCGYVSKLATQPHHPSYGPVFHPVLSNRYELNITVSQPVGVRFHQLLRQLDIFLPHIIPYRLCRFPQWEITRLTCDLRLVSLVRGATSPLTNCWCFAELLSAYPDHTAVYTDGALFMNRQAVPSYIMARYFRIVYIILTAYSLLNSMLYTELFCSSGVSISSAIQFAQTP